jgi:hypothetical protein
VGLSVRRGLKITATQQNLGRNLATEALLVVVIVVVPDFRGLGQFANIVVNSNVMGSKLKLIPWPPPVVMVVKEPGNLSPTPELLVELCESWQRHCCLF